MNKSLSTQKKDKMGFRHRKGAKGEKIILRGEKDATSFGSQMYRLTGTKG